MCLSLNSIVLEWPSRFHEPGVRFQVCPWNAAVQASRKTRIFTFSSLLSLSLPPPFFFLPSPLAKPRISMRLSAYTFRLSPTRDSFSVRRSLWASDYTPSCAFDRSSFLCRCSVYDTGRDRRPLISKAGDKVYSATTTVGKWHGMSPLALMTEKLVSLRFRRRNIRRIFRDSLGMVMWRQAGY